MFNYFAIAQGTNPVPKVPKSVFRRPRTPEAEEQSFPPAQHHYAAVAMNGQRLNV